MAMSTRSSRISAQKIFYKEISQDHRQIFEGNITDSSTFCKCINHEQSCSEILCLVMMLMLQTTGRQNKNLTYNTSVLGKFMDQSVSHHSACSVHFETMKNWSHKIFYLQARINDHCEKTISGWNTP